MVSGVLIFLVLDQCPVQVEGFYTRFRSTAVLAPVIHLGFFKRQISYCFIVWMGCSQAVRDG